MVNFLAPTVFATLAKGGSVGGSWTFPASWETAEDANYATSPAVSAVGEYTPYANLSAFGLSLASTILIAGIGLRLVFGKSSGTARVEIDDVRLVQSGVIVGNNVAGLMFPTRYECFTTDFDVYGNQISLGDFGLDLDGADLDSNFGIAVSAKCIVAGTAAYMQIDYAQGIFAHTGGREMGYGIPIDASDALAAAQCQETGLVCPGSRLRQTEAGPIVDFAYDRGWRPE